MEPGRNPVRVTIFNQSYSLLATEEPGEVESLAESVDELMSDIARRLGSADANRVAVLACLHLADRLRALERELADPEAASTRPQFVQQASDNSVE